MKTTERKLEANRTNGRRTTGPKSLEGKGRSSQNSIVHNLFSKRLHFKNEDEKSQYSAVHSDLVEYFAPRGSMEMALVDKIAALLWNQGNAFGILSERTEEYRTGRLVSQLAKFVGKAGLIEQAIPTQSLSGGDRTSSLECRELLLRVVKSHAESNREAENKVGKEDSTSDTSGDANQDRTEFEARMGPSMDTVMRCYTTIERSLDRTINQLLGLQRSREDDSRSG